MIKINFRFKIKSELNIRIKIINSFEDEEKINLEIFRINLKNN